MRKSWWTSIILVIPLCAIAQKNVTDDEQAIRKVIADEISAWNRHEADLVPEALAEDYDIVLPTGQYFRGKPHLGKAFSTILKNAHKVAFVERIRFVRPDVALVDGKFEISGAEIQPYPKGLQTWVMVKENQRWRLVANREMIPVVLPSPSTSPDR